ncbi:hypothetical protein GE21DRAFT_1348491 [Neurospora crassa]|uniref:Uncharacterized protein B23G1.150 n=1 Tax=Neurospora crassa TaxID=5141 RepID=Q872T9_NEUCS|nr:hypothetical protein GE21DRAFT_1348491 [Neurospora crassa]CAD70477.1 hypothetical protein [Neurospora crassa]
MIGLPVRCSRRCSPLDSRERKAQKPGWKLDSANLPRPATGTRGWNLPGMERKLAGPQFAKGDYDVMARTWGGEERLRARGHGATARGVIPFGLRSAQQMINVH